MKEFIVENYQMLILICACLLDLILFLCSVFKKKNSVPLEDVFHAIPEMIKYVEKSVGPGNGPSKKSIVLELACRWYKKLTGVQLVAGSRIYETISDFIEQVLETPQKKGK